MRRSSSGLIHLAGPHATLHGAVTLALLTKCIVRMFPFLPLWCCKKFNATSLIRSLKKKTKQELCAVFFWGNINMRFWGFYSISLKPVCIGFQMMKWFYISIFFAVMSRQSAALSSTTQHAMPREFGGKWGTEWLNTTSPLPSMMRAGNSVTLKKNR